jgi:hypothetical protein
MEHLICVNVGISYGTIILESIEECRTEDHSRFKEKSQRGKAFNETLEGNKMV